jgi:hypothetical protein
MSRWTVFATYAGNCELAVADADLAVGVVGYGGVVSDQDDRGAVLPGDADEQVHDSSGWWVSGPIATRASAELAETVRASAALRQKSLCSVSTGAGIRMIPGLSLMLSVW